MDFNQLLKTAEVLASVVGLSLFFYFYFTKESFRGAVKKVIQYVPAVLALAKGFITDKKGEFDTYDALELLSQVSLRIRETIEDPTNKSFADVEEEVFAIVSEELAKYKNLPGVPNLDDPAVRTQVRMVFESIQRSILED